MVIQFFFKHELPCNYSLTEVSQAPLPKGLKGLKGSKRGEKGRMLCCNWGRERGGTIVPFMPFSPLYTLYSFDLRKLNH